MIEGLQQANNRIIIMLQKLAFPNEVQDLIIKTTPSKVNRLISLNPFMNAEGIIRVRGRLA